MPLNFILKTLYAPHLYTTPTTPLYSFIRPDILPFLMSELLLLEFTIPEVSFFVNGLVDISTEVIYIPPWAQNGLDF